MVRVHYDSSKLTLESRQSLLSTDYIGSQDQPDDEDYDDNAATDRRLLVAWAAQSVQWPGEGTSFRSR